MKIAYIDLNKPDHYESYSTNPKRYGGGRIFASWAKEKINNFHIFATDRSFQDVTPNENTSHCHNITQEQVDKIRSGEQIETVIPECNDVDIFVHHFSNLYINTKKAQVVWPVGYAEPVHPNIKNLMLYSRNRQSPQITNDCNIYDVRIGVEFPDIFVENVKEDFIFQCTRHVREFCSIEVANFCNQNNIQCVFAGPIVSDYPLLNFIDNKNTHYIGEISEEDKISYTKRARLSTFLHNWNTPFNLSAVLCLGYGTPIVSTPIGFWPDLISNGKNGFIVNSNEELLNAWEQSKNISQFECFNSVANKYDTRSMLNSFESSIISVYNNHI